MIRWLRVVLPPSWAIVTAGIIYFGLEAFCFGWEWYVGVSYPSPNSGEPFVAVMVMFAICYAVYRVWAFHPVLRPGYYNWLRVTPWTSGKPLPLGPVHLVLQDVMILGVMVGLCWPRAGMVAQFVIHAFLFAYLSTLAAAHGESGQKAWAYAVAFGLGFMLLFVPNWGFYVAAGVTYVAALVGWRRVLAGFPWPERAAELQRLHESLKINLFSKRAAEKTNRSLGWPCDRLGPGFPNAPFCIAIGDALVIGLLAGWWFFVAGYHLRHLRTIDIDLAGNFARLIFPGCVIARIFVYCHGYVPPLSLLGRVAHGRLIIPGYDQVLVAPLLAVLAFVAAHYLPLWTGLPELIALPMGVTAVCWILLGMGPSLNDWRLTGNHRIVKGLMVHLGQQNG